MRCEEQLDKEDQEVDAEFVRFFAAFSSFIEERIETEADAIARSSGEASRKRSRAPN